MRIGRKILTLLVVAVVVFASETRLCAAAFNAGERFGQHHVRDARGGKLIPGFASRQKDRPSCRKLGPEAFTLVLANGEIISSAKFKLIGKPRIEPLLVNTNAARFAERLPGWELVAHLASQDGNLEVTWRAILRDGSRYLREELVFHAGKNAVPLKGIGMYEAPNVTAHATGTVDGCPVADKTTFYGVEHPLSINRAEMGFVRCYLPRGAAIEAGEDFECSMVVGFVRPGQLRRDFLASHLERERAHPYRPFLHFTIPVYEHRLFQPLRSSRHLERHSFLW